MKIYAVGAYAEASTEHEYFDYVILPEGMIIEEECKLFLNFKEAAKDFKILYSFSGRVPDGIIDPNIEFHEWLLLRGAITPTEDQLEVFQY